MITSIPWIWIITDITILGEIWAIIIFSNPSKLAVYAGIDAMVSQSGGYQSINNKISEGKHHLLPLEQLLASFAILFISSLKIILLMWCRLSDLLLDSRHFLSSHTSLHILTWVLSGLFVMCIFICFLS